MKIKTEDVLKEWRSQSKIAEMLSIDCDNVWEIFRERKIIQKKCIPNSYYPHSYIMLYKEEESV